MTLNAFFDSVMKDVEYLDHSSWLSASVTVKKSRLNIEIRNR
jgi:hypothetical protein